MLSSFIFLSLLHLSRACSEDNCARAFQNRAARASGFCSTYTQAANTATTALPPYATKCNNSPSRISSACSCLVAGATSTASQTAGPATTCVPSLLKDPTFAGMESGGGAWTVTVNQDPSQTISPEWSFIGPRFEADFPNFQPNPFLSTVTISQAGLTVCNGLNSILWQFVSTINAIAATPVPQQYNCSITSGLTNIPRSAQTLNAQWETPFGVLEGTNYAFPVLGLPDAGALADFYITMACPLADWWPEVQVYGVAVNTEYLP